ncbi:hypothetical protein RAS1_18370 [Phycisphaerae bacterium RAS1]|nr:hypothetical protein RAS1_18370 [Phycisphaerae bacterium RAS1]
MALTFLSADSNKEVLHEVSTKGDVRRRDLTKQRNEKLQDFQSRKMRHSTVCAGDLARIRLEHARACAQDYCNAVFQVVEADGIALTPGQLAEIGKHVVILISALQRECETDIHSELDHMAVSSVSAQMLDANRQRFEALMKEVQREIDVRGSQLKRKLRKDMSTSWKQRREQGIWVLIGVGVTLLTQWLLRTLGLPP